MFQKIKWKYRTRCKMQLPNDCRRSRSTMISFRTLMGIFRKNGHFSGKMAINFLNDIVALHTLEKLGGTIPTSIKGYHLPFEKDSSDVPVTWEWISQPNWLLNQETSYGLSQREMNKIRKKTIGGSNLIVYACFWVQECAFIGENYGICFRPSESELMPLPFLTSVCIVFESHLGLAFKRSAYGCNGIMSLNRYNQKSGLKPIKHPLTLFLNTIIQCWNITWTTIFIAWLIFSFKWGARFSIIGWIRCYNLSTLLSPASTGHRAFTPFTPAKDTIH